MTYWFSLFIQADTSSLGSRSENTSDTTKANGSINTSSSVSNHQESFLIWKDKVMELAHRLRVERALFVGSKKAVNAVLDNQIHVDKSRKLQVRFFSCLIPFLNVFRSLTTGIAKIKTSSHFLTCPNTPLFK